MEFAIHPSEDLVSLFNKRPYQGQSPEKADILFLSSDANYSPEISTHNFFDYITEYQADGIAFWEKYGCHHPFLLPDFPFNKNTGGRPFHRNFSKIGLTAKYAPHISFIELLDVPTIGNKSSNKNLFYSLISLDHINYLEKLILSGGHKLLFVSGGVLRDIIYLQKKFKLFDWLDYVPNSKQQYSAKINGNMVKEIYHFSAWQIHGQLAEIRETIDSWLDTT